MFNVERQDMMRRLGWPVYGVTATHVDTAYYVNGVRVIVYPSGKIDAIRRVPLAKRRQPAWRLSPCGL
jgi:hypothetical protein